MSDLVRLRPDRLPAIHPVPEYLASGQLHTWYEEMKHALDVPWMGVVTMALAHYPNFFRELWRGLRPIVESESFVAACGSLRIFTEQQVDAFQVPSLLPALARTGYAGREIDAIRNVVEIFSRGNFPYLLIATLVRVLLEGGRLSGHPPGPAASRHRDATPSPAPLVLMEAHHADAPTRAVFADIKATLGLPFVNTDYRAFARWPSYFAQAWAGLKPCVASERYEPVCRSVHDRATIIVTRELPDPSSLDAAVLREAAAADADRGDVTSVARLFQWLLPGLVTNVAILRAQLGPVCDA
ncbi:MAG: hypothetical protein GC151_08260 [Betaproteobacteria bacterium]|nr:hypothetical protein [Betaproteobacteria bacterium]